MSMSILLRSLTLAAIALASGTVARRNCTTAMLACGSIEETAHGVGPLSATGKTGEEGRGTKAMLEAGGLGLLVVLAILFVLGRRVRCPM
jgi:hypothetical protein